MQYEPPEGGPAVPIELWPLEALVRISPTPIAIDAGSNFHQQFKYLARCSFIVFFLNCRIDIGRVGGRGGEEGGLDR